MPTSLKIEGSDCAPAGEQFYNKLTLVADTFCICGRQVSLWGNAMKLPRRYFLHLTAATAAVPIVTRTAIALDYPTRPVHIVVGFATGNTPDVLARLFAQSLSEQLKQHFIVDDRPGAASNVGTETVVRAPPDGYTLLAVTSTNAINATLYDRLSFDFIWDIAPVAGTARLPAVLTATPSFPAKTVPELIAYCKANPGKVTVASPGVGTATHVIGELFKVMTGIDMLHVPYRANYMTDLLAGQVQVAFSAVAQTVEFIKAGKLRALAVTGARRSHVLPDVPAVAEYVPGFEGYVWDGIGAPKNTPVDVINTLNNAVNNALADSDMKARFIEMGAEPMVMTPAEFGKFISSETEKWAQVVKFAGIKAD
jgi:tripartite-type tricarboxylate transporter receptor subunit TctC